MNKIECKKLYPQFHCPIELEIEIKNEKQFLVPSSLEHLQEHFLPDHKELKEEQEKTELLENYI